MAREAAKVLPSSPAAAPLDAAQESPAATSGEAGPATTAPAKSKRPAAGKRPARSGSVLLPGRLTEAALRGVLDGLQGEVEERCFKRLGIVTGTTVRLDVSVGPEGGVTEVVARPRGLNVVTCILERVGAARFPRSLEGGSGKYTFTAGD